MRLLIAIGLLTTLAACDQRTIGPDGDAIVRSGVVSDGSDRDTSMDDDSASMDDDSASMDDDSASMDDDSSSMDDDSSSMDDDSSSMDDDSSSMGDMDDDTDLGTDFDTDLGTDTDTMACREIGCTCVENPDCAGGLVCLGGVCAERPQAIE